MWDQLIKTTFLIQIDCPINHEVTTMKSTIDISSLIVPAPESYAGRPQISGKELFVEQIATLSKEGLSAQQIKEEYSCVTLAEVHAALAYYYANYEQIEDFLAEETATYQQLSLSF